MKPAVRLVAAWALGLAWAVPAWSMNLKYVEPTAPPAPSAASMLLRTGVALAIVVGLIYGAAWLVRRAQPGMSRPGRARGQVAVESHVPLGPKRSLYAVRWGKFRLLLGAGTTDITLLASEWADEEAAAQPAGELPDEEQFGRRLDDFLSRLGRVEDEPRA